MDLSLDYPLVFLQFYFHSIIAIQFLLKTFKQNVCQWKHVLGLFQNNYYFFYEFKTCLEVISSALKFEYCTHFGIK